MYARHSLPLTGNHNMRVMCDFPLSVDLTITDFTSLSTVTLDSVSENTDIWSAFVIWPSR